MYELFKLGVLFLVEFAADLKHRMRGVWRGADLVDPNMLMHNNKPATHHPWFAIPVSSNEHLPTTLPR
jgi:hypothetical protein